MSRPIAVQTDERELATILAALRFHQDENLQGRTQIPDLAIREIATNAGVLEPLSFEDVDRLCGKLNRGHSSGAPVGLTVDPPHQDGGDEPLFRVVYVIDLNAVGPHEAARQAHRVMVDPDSLPPVLDVLDYSGRVTQFDLSGEHTRKGDDTP